MIEITNANAGGHGLDALMRVDSWLYRIDDDDAEMRARMSESIEESKEDGEDRTAVKDTDLDSIVPGIERIEVTADVWPMIGEVREERTILTAELMQDATVLEILGIARDAYLACMALAGRTNNGGAGTDFDEGMTIFAEKAEERLRGHRAIADLSSFVPVPTVYCSYTAWWEGCGTSLEGRTLVLKPHLGS
jgi:hypothetical protein